MVYLLIWKFNCFFFNLDWLRRRFVVKISDVNNIGEDFIVVGFSDWNICVISVKNVDKIYFSFRIFCVKWSDWCKGDIIKFWDDVCKKWIK